MIASSPPSLKEDAGIAEDHAGTTRSLAAALVAAARAILNTDAFITRE